MVTCRPSFLSRLILAPHNQDFQSFSSARILDEPRTFYQQLRQSGMYHQSLIDGSSSFSLAPVEIPVTYRNSTDSSFHSQPCLIESLRLLVTVRWLSYPARELPVIGERSSREYQLFSNPLLSLSIPNLADLCINIASPRMTQRSLST